MRQTVVVVWSLLLAVAVQASAQLVDPAAFSVQTERVSANEIVITFAGTIEQGWHVYATNVAGGPTPATFTLESSEGVELVGSLQEGGGAVEKMDDVFGCVVRYFEGKAVFRQRVRLTAPSYRLVGYLEYGACSATMCTAPARVDVDFEGSDGPVPVAQAAPVEEEKGEITEEIDTVAVAATCETTDSADTWAPVVDLLQSSQGSSGERSNWAIFLLGLLGGLVALVTPCVWPIIPLTVGFFIHRSGNRRRAVRDALIYGLSIIIIYVVVSLLLTSWRGGDYLNALSTNAVVNVFFCLLLLVFGVSLLGAFDLSLPSSWTTGVNDRAEKTGGFIGIFLMAFTLVLVSFSCTAPIVGFLLVDIVSSGRLLAPAIGMLGFALALALPFTLFALFPSWMKKMPKSGGWMEHVKVTLGFLELAFALKFLSIADLTQGWGLLDREVFLSLWIVLAVLLGAYYLGWLKLHDDYGEGRGIGTWRMLLGLVSLSFAVYMVPGLWGAPLKAVSAFAPPMYTQDFNLDGRTVEADYNDYDVALEAARREGKPLVVDFSGYGCVNCRKMEAAVWTDARVRDLLEDEFVLVSLFVDDRTPLREPMTVVEQGKERTLKTVGEKWSYLQRSKFGVNAQPFYVVLDGNGRPLGGSYAFDEDAGKFAAWLQEALRLY